MRPVAAAAWYSMQFFRKNHGAVWRGLLRIGGNYPDSYDSRKQPGGGFESRALALDHAYLHGRHKDSADPHHAAPLPRDYLKDARALAEKQATLADSRRS